LPHVNGDAAVVGELVGIPHQIEQCLPQFHLIDMRRTGGATEIAAEFVRLKVDVIVTM
jgi:hypothetical protein